MSGTIAVDTAHMRAAAEELAGANVGADPRSRMADPGSRRALLAVERFVEYWDPALSTMTETLDALAGSLSAAAGAYELRDAVSAGTFDGRVHAF